MTRKTVTREARIPTDLTACRMGDTDFQALLGKSRSHRYATMPDGAAGQGAPTSGRHRARRAAGLFIAVRLHGAQALGPTALVEPKFCHFQCTDQPNAGIPAEKLNHLGTGGPSRRPPSAGCAGPHRENWPGRRRSLACASLRLVTWAPCAMFSVRVAPSATRRALPSMRNAGHSVESAPTGPATAWSPASTRGVSASRPRYSVVSRGYRWSRAERAPDVTGGGRCRI